MHLTLRKLAQLATGTTVSVLALSAITALPAQASASHENTDPHLTGCESGAITIGSKAVSGGTAYIKYSKNCGTNWVLYSGTSQKTTKKGHASGKAWTTTQVDTGPYSYSFQSYAPGTTSYTGSIQIGSTVTTASCVSTCTWKVTSTSTSLSAKVDAFVTKWNGKYADFDGAYGAQCVDLAQYYNRDVVGAKFMTTPTSGGAKDIWNTYDTTRYTRVSAGSTPAKGDVAIWGSSMGGGYGHIAIVLANGSGTVKVLTQNPGATKIAYITKSGLLGYLRPRS